MRNPWSTCGVQNLPILLRSWRPRQVARASARARKWRRHVYHLRLPREVAPSLTRVSARVPQKRQHAAALQSVRSGGGAPPPGGSLHGLPRHSKTAPYAPFDEPAPAHVALRATPQRLESLHSRSGAQNLPILLRSRRPRHVARASARARNCGNMSTTRGDRGKLPGPLREC